MQHFAYFVEKNTEPNELSSAELSECRRVQKYAKYLHRCVEHVGMVQRRNLGDVRQSRPGAHNAKVIVRVVKIPINTKIKENI